MKLQQLSTSLYSLTFFTHDKLEDHIHDAARAVRASTVLPKDVVADDRLKYALLSGKWDTTKTRTPVSGLVQRLTTLKNSPKRGIGGVCVALKHGLVFVATRGEDQLCVYSLVDGSLVRIVGCRGAGEGQFRFDFGGLCVSPDGNSVLVAELYNHRVQQVQIVVAREDESTFVRFVGVGVLRYPQYVDCDENAIVVSERACGMSLLWWATGHLIAQFSNYVGGLGRFVNPEGVRLLRGQKPAFIVADSGADRVCVFTFTGECVAAVKNSELGMVRLLENTGGFIEVDDCSDDLVKLSRARTGLYSQVKQVKLPDGGIMVRQSDGGRLQFVYDLDPRIAWITACQ